MENLTIYIALGGLIPKGLSNNYSGWKTALATPNKSEGNNQTVLTTSLWHRTNKNKKDLGEIRVWYPRKFNRHTKKQENMTHKEEKNQSAKKQHRIDTTVKIR